MRRRIAALWVVAAALAGAANGQAPAPAPAAPKVAISSLVGDTMTVTVYREATATNLRNESTVLKMPGPLLDILLLKAAQAAMANAVPEAQVFPLRVAAAGSDVDPAAVVADDKLVTGNVLVDALRQQGFTHLLTATKYRHNNAIRLRDGSVHSRGQLEGLGFYVDPSLTVQNTRTGDRSVGIVAPYLYIQFRLVDLATLEVRTHPVTANSVAGASRNKDGVDAWGALTAQEKIEAAERLINTSVAAAVPALFARKP